MILLLFTIIKFIAILRFIRRKSPNTILTVVLGDTGHSPRSLAHCTAAEKLGLSASILGYDLSRTHSNSKNIDVISIQPYPKFLQENLPTLRADTVKRIFF